MHDLKLGGAVTTDFKSYNVITLERGTLVTFNRKYRLTNKKPEDYGNQFLVFYDKDNKPGLSKGDEKVSITHPWTSVYPSIVSKRQPVTQEDISNFGKTVGKISAQARSDRKKLYRLIKPQKKGNCLVGPKDFLFYLEDVFFKPPLRLNRPFSLKKPYSASEVGSLQNKAKSQGGTEVVDPARCHRAGAAWPGFILYVGDNVKPLLLLMGFDNGIKNYYNVFDYFGIKLGPAPDVKHGVNKAFHIDLKPKRIRTP